MIINNNNNNNIFNNKEINYCLIVSRKFAIPPKFPMTPMRVYIESKYKQEKDSGVSDDDVDDDDDDDDIFITTMMISLILLWCKCSIHQ